MRTKLLSLIIGAAMLAAVTVKAQTNVIPTVPAFFGMMSSNVFSGAAMIYDLDSRKVGGRVGVAYSMLDGLTVPELALEYFDGGLDIVSGTLQIGLPNTIWPQSPFRPFAEAGAKIPVAGLGGSNGNPVGFVGSGFTARFSRHFLLFAAYEYRLTGDHKGGQILFGPVWNF